MREIKDLTINEGDNAYKFRLTQLSAISLQKWAFKAGVLLASSGVLDADAENTDVTEIINVISKKGFSFLGKIDADEAHNLLMELVEKTAKRVVNNNTLLDVNENELENIFSDIKSLFSLEKEVFKINFSFFNKEKLLNSDTSQKEAEQLSMFVDHQKRDRRILLEDAVEDIRRRFGKRAISYAILMGDLKIPDDGRQLVTMPGLMYQ